ncbi:MOSC domain-containing protein [Bacillus spongiae]|uniref:MOSC domain-containing protein n=1 Tax=Bacillus spongiae TaxID=2683610 RepID=A0ABU8HHT3_9BACI
MNIHSLAIGLPKQLTYKNQAYKSGIQKEPVKVLQVSKHGIVGDDVANHTFHGGVDRVICAYPFEHYAFWKSYLGHSLVLPAFGENMTLCGMRERDVMIGDIYKVSDCLLQVSQGRIPCATISKFNQSPKLLQYIVEKGYTGYFFRVVEGGEITLQSPIELVERKENEISILRANQILFHENNDKNELQRLLDQPDLAEDWKKKIEAKMKKMSN